VPEVRRVDAEDPYFVILRDGWSSRLRQTFRDLPPPEWL
jgi:putative proteasome-type protease